MVVAVLHVVPDDALAIGWRVCHRLYFRMKDTAIAPAKVEDGRAEAVARLHLLPELEVDVEVMLSVRICRL